jgi:hypothetical protein
MAAAAGPVDAPHAHGVDGDQMRRELEEVRDG